MFVFVFINRCIIFHTDSCNLLWPHRCTPAGTWREADTRLPGRGSRLPVGGKPFCVLEGAFFAERKIGSSVSGSYTVESAKRKPTCDEERVALHEDVCSGWTTQTETIRLCSLPLPGLELDFLLPVTERQVRGQTLALGPGTAACQGPRYGTPLSK